MLLKWVKSRNIYCGVKKKSQSSGSAVLITTMKFLTSHCQCLWADLLCWNSQKFTCFPIPVYVGENIYFCPSFLSILFPAFPRFHIFNTITNLSKSFLKLTFYLKDTSVIQFLVTINLFHLKRRWVNRSLVMIAILPPGSEISHNITCWVKISLKQHSLTWCLFVNSKTCPSRICGGHQFWEKLNLANLKNIFSWHCHWYLDNFSIIGNERSLKLNVWRNHYKNNGQSSMDLTKAWQKSMKNMRA